MPCDGCREKDLRIAELEKTLEGAIFVNRDEAVDVAFALGLTASQAGLVVVLFRARRAFTSKWALDEALPRPKDRRDPTETSANVVQVHIVRIRKKLGADFIETQWGQGFRLSEAARQRVAEILKEPA